MQYVAKIKLAREGVFANQDIPTSDELLAIIDDFETKNKVVTGAFTIDKNIITVEFDKKVPTETEAQNIALPLVPIIVGSGIVIGALWVWRWTVTGVADAANALDNLFDNAFFMAAVLGIVGYLAVTAFKKVIRK